MIVTGTASGISKQLWQLHGYILLRNGSPDSFNLEALRIKLGILLTALPVEIVWSEDVDKGPTSLRAGACYVFSSNHFLLLISLHVKSQSHQACGQVTTYLRPKNGPIVERTYDWWQRSYDWWQRSWVIARGKSVATWS